MFPVLKADRVKFCPVGQFHLDLLIPPFVVWIIRGDNQDQGPVDEVPLLALTVLNSLTAIGAHERQLFNELHCSLVILPIFVHY